MRARYASVTSTGETSLVRISGASLLSHDGDVGVEQWIEAVDALEICLGDLNWRYVSRSDL